MGKPRKYHQGLDWSPTPVRWPPLVPSSVYEYALLECMGVVEVVNPRVRGREHFRAQLFDCQDGACYWCWKPMSWDRIRETAAGRRKSNPAFASFEHLRRRRDGGKFTRKNIVLAHESCNRTRDGARYPHDPYPVPRNQPMSTLHNDQIRDLIDGIFNQVIELRSRLLAAEFKGSGPLTPIRLQRGFEQISQHRPTSHAVVAMPDRVSPDAATFAYADPTDQPGPG